MGIRAITELYLKYISVRQITAKQKKARIVCLIHETYLLAYHVCLV